MPTSLRRLTLGRSFADIIDDRRRSWSMAPSPTNLQGQSLSFGVRDLIIMGGRADRRRRQRRVAIFLLLLSLSASLQSQPAMAFSTPAARLIQFADNSCQRTRRYTTHRQVMAIKTKSSSSSSFSSSSSPLESDHAVANRTTVQSSESASHSTFLPPAAAALQQPQPPSSSAVVTTVAAGTAEMSDRNGGSEVAYDLVLMPRPSRLDSLEPASRRTHSLVSWEEVLMPVPSAKKGARVDMVVMAGAMAALISLFASLIVASGPGAWRYYLSGGICAATSHAIPVPIDVVKTRKQVDPALANHGFLAATRHIIQHEGIKALLVGLGPTTVGYLVEGSIKFGVYEATKPVIRNMLTSLAQLSSGMSFLNSHVLSLILSGAASGVAAALALCPMESLRIRLVAQQGYATNWVQGGYKMLQNEGPSSMIKGMRPMMYKQVPYTIVKNVSFDLGTKALYAVLRSQAVALTPTIKLAIPFASAAVASVLSCVISHPGDMLLSLVTAREGDSRRTNDIIRDILRSERGLAGFFVGLKTRLLHVGVIVTVQLLIYDLVKQLCGIAPTGSV